MNASSTLVLPPDVVIVPVERLAPEVRAMAACQDGDSAITRPRSRAPSRILDRDSARLVAEFREPTTLLAAVLRYCLAERLEPEPTLEASWPLLQGLIRARLLVPEDSEEARDIQPSLRPGDSLHGFQVVRCVQVMEDMEVFEARSPEGEPVALKVARGEAAGPRALLAHEARVLRALAGQVAPRLIDSGREFLAMEWCPGTRVAPSSGGRDEALARGVAVLETFAALHARGVVHGDVHPGNMLLAPDGSVRLVDFGLARLLGEPADSAPPRGGVAFFHEPELARATLTGRRPPPASVAGEQYSLAAMVWWLLTGHYAFDFSLERREMLRQLAEATPLPFSARGLEPWPEVEAVLLRALRKEPSERHASVADLARALRESREPGRRVEVRGVGADGLLESVLEKARPGGLWMEQGFPAVPCCSVNFGAAGLAHALYRMAVQRDAPELLSLADVWCVRALQRMGEPHAFLLPEQDLSEDVVDPSSVLHTASGLHVVRALVAHAMGDAPTCERAVADFLGGLQGPWRVLDLALGRGGALLGCSLLHEALPCPSLLAAGAQVARELMERLEQHGTLAEERAPLNLGMAHGWAGMLYVLLRWCETSGTAVPAFVKARLDELAGLGEPTGCGLRWRWEWARQGDAWVSVSMPGWCNGSAGYVFLWSLAHRMLGNPRWLELAELAAWDAWDGGPGPANLCCGLTGRAYALLNVYRATGDSVWMERARCLGERAVALSHGPEPHPGSLFKGEVGLALLLSDLRTPETARMPFFEGEGWPQAR